MLVIVVSSPHGRFLKPHWRGGIPERNSWRFFVVAGGDGAELLQLHMKSSLRWHAM
jgi:hypothetical protein